MNNVSHTRTPPTWWQCPPVSLLNTDKGSSIVDLDVITSTSKDLSGITFENRIMQLLKAKDFNVTQTKKTSDGGIDLIAFSDNPIMSGKYIVQCKDWTDPVGVSVVRELYGVVHSEDANKGILITTSLFTQEAKKFAEGKRILLIDHNNLKILEEDLVKSSQISNNVSFRSIISSNYFKGEMKLPVILGTDLMGTSIVVDLTKSHNILLAGIEEDPKDKVVDSILLSLLFYCSPNELKLILIDSNGVKLSLYNGIPHLLTPVITDMYNVNNALQWAVREMEQRYTVLKSESARNIEGYNENKDNSEKMSNIIIVIDEMADLMSVNESVTKTHLNKICYAGNVVGIYLILNTNGISKYSLPENITAGIMTRLLSHTPSVKESKFILDEGGGESLDNKSLILRTPSLMSLKHISPVELTANEIERVLLYIKAQSPESHEPPVQSSVQSHVDEYEDSLFPEAVKVVVEAQRGSESILQSKLKIGYARAARLILELENSSVVGPQDGSKPRDVLITDADVFLDQLNKQD